jgi:hypothetical protein
MSVKKPVANPAHFERVAVPINAGKAVKAGAAANAATPKNIPLMVTTLSVSLPTRFKSTDSGGAEPSFVENKDPNVYWLCGACAK